MDKLTHHITNSRLRKSLSDRLWSQILFGSRLDCWNWTGKAQADYGYGRMSAGSEANFKSHRVAWALIHGPIPNGLCVCHRCDNPKCCNPSHLFLGTKKDNTRDMMQKHRHSPPPHYFAAEHHAVKFGVAAAKQIASDPRPAWQIAAEYGISEKTVYRVRKGETWHSTRVNLDSTLSGNSRG